MLLDRRDFIRMAGAGVLGSAVLPGCSRETGAADAPAPRPNIVLILADDMGSECLGAYGGLSYPTPHLDALARDGMRFEHCYATPMCVPSRVQIMTGRYNVRNYEGWFQLNARERTFGNYLKGAGYATCIAGKWQLSRGFEQPRRFGFDEYCLWLLTRPPQRARRYASPQLEIDGREVDFASGAYGPDVVTDHLCAFMQRSREQEQPFFVYYPMLLPHWPFGPTPDSPDWDPEARPTEEVGRGDAERFPGMVAYADKMVGKLVRQVDVLGLRERTLILFTTDNGTHRMIRSQTTRGPVRGGKRSLSDAGTRVPLIARWPGFVPAAQVSDGLVDLSDIVPTLCEAGGAALPGDRELDGRSFLPQLRGKRGDPREWVYCWYAPTPSSKVEAFARNQRYKRYRSGAFFDVAADPLESNPLDVAALDPGARAAFESLGAVLARYGRLREAA